MMHSKFDHTVNGGGGKDEREEGEGEKGDETKKRIDEYADDKEGCWSIKFAIGPYQEGRGN